MLCTICTTDKKYVQINPEHIASVLDKHRAVEITLANGQKFTMEEYAWLRSDLRAAIR